MTYTHMRNMKNTGSFIDFYFAFDKWLIYWVLIRGEIFFFLKSSFGMPESDLGFFGDEKVVKKMVQKMLKC